MSLPFKRHATWALVWGVATLIGCQLLAGRELTAQRSSFEADARSAHRLLSQRAVQHDAVLATLALLGTADSAVRPEQRLSSVYPQIIAVQRRERNEPWTDARLNAPEAESRQLGRAVLADIDPRLGRYQLVLAAQPTSYLLQIDIRGMVPWSEWPMAPDASPVRVVLSHADAVFVLQPGRTVTAPATGWDFEFRKTLAADSQPLELVLQRQVGWAELPWPWMAAWSLLMALLLLGARAWLRQAQERHRAEELLRLGQVARLNTLGELAAGMAHELNPPLTAVLTHTQTACRLLDEDSPDLSLVRHAMTQAIDQARRATEVIGRLRRTVERPELGARLQAINMHGVAHKVLDLLEPEFHQHEVVPTMEIIGAAFKVLAEPVALEQIIHNLLMNALQALEKMPANNRRLSVTLRSDETMGSLTLCDNGPGLSAVVLPRIFEPFFSTRDGGLGLGLNLCQTLASGMGGSLTATNRLPHGAEFCLHLPLSNAVQTHA